MKNHFLLVSLITTCMLGSCVNAGPAEAETMRGATTKKQNQISKGSQSRAFSNLKQTSETSDPAKVQEEFQKEFARELAAAGPKAEGWALFSESGMSFPGQRWIIRTNDAKNDQINLCTIVQGEKTCTRKTITKKQFDSVSATFTKADKLSHLLPTVFDGINFEYLHARAGVPLTNRVVFITSATPFPPDYEAIVMAFKSLSEAK